MSQSMKRLVMPLGNIWERLQEAFGDLQQYAWSTRIALNYEGYIPMRWLQIVEYGTIHWLAPMNLLFSNLKCQSFVVTPTPSLRRG